MSSISSVSSYTPITASLTKPDTCPVACSTVDTVSDLASSIVSFSEESVAKLSAALGDAATAVGDAATAVGDAVSNGIQTVEDEVSAGATAVGNMASSVGDAISSAATSTAAYLALGVAEGKQLVNEVA